MPFARLGQVVGLRRSREELSEATRDDAGIDREYYGLSTCLLTLLKANQTQVSELFAEEHGAAAREASRFQMPFDAGDNLPKSFRRLAAHLIYPALR